MTDSTELDQAAAVGAFTAWLEIDRRRYPVGDRQLADSYTNAPITRSDMEALVAANRALAQASAERTAELGEARELARVMYGILNSLPTDIGGYDGRLEFDALPEWLGGGE